MISKAECLDALREVVDPEIGINIVDVGLVYRVEPKEDSIEVDFTLTSPGCPLADTIMQDIHDSLQKAAGDDIEIKTELVWNPPWSIEFLSEEARLELGYPI
ncbi:MAG: metal-sulfur cluster assembly factor [Spirochaeta sp.]